MQQGRGVVTLEEVYEVTGNYGSCIFRSQEDTVSALWLLAQYHGLELRREEASRKLGSDGHYEAFPLSARECMV